ncbi:Peptidyl-prolyl cis-trans isomerase D [Sinobacterium norvegicum]|uniref:Periplasmic chaperone PpiD n=1 Tax=Sinobacterium norvegicum TaxID=1641715 RepID=A0ABM9AAC4_9GAMM|nr:SurA N-terminal domain-containing protein [Sinobacterium norvegicum]CAH0990164.1 Peptidyl-prolyl cis-trans isomerase D [Sinobacterium norvegicum]
MIQNIRDNSQGLIAKIIIGIMIVPLAFFGVDALFNSAPSSDVATVNGEAISENELSREVNQQMQRLASQMGEGFDINSIDSAIVRKPALDQLVENKLLLQKASEEKFRVSDNFIDQIILQDSTFHEEGVFSRTRFDAILRQAGLTTGGYKALLFKQVLMSQYASGVAYSDFATSAELAAAAQLLKQKRGGEYVVLSAEQVRQQVNVSEEEAQTYYQENAAQFMTDEAVSVNYIQLSVEDLFKPIDEKVLRDSYSEQVALFNAGTERHVAHILIEVNDTLNQQQAIDKVGQIKARIEAGEDFAVVAEELSEDIGSASMGGDLGVTDGTAFPEAFEQAAAELDVDQLSDAVVTDAGVHLIKLLAVDKIEPPTFEQSRAEIELTIQQQNSQTEYIQLLESLKDYTFNAEDLAGPAKDLDLTVATSEAFTRQGGNGIFSNAAVIKAAFSADVLTGGNNSDVVELDDSTAVVMHLSKHDKAEQIAFAEIRADIVQILTDQKVAEELDTLSQQLLSGNADNLQQVADDNALALTVIEPVSREASASLLPAIAQALFTLPPADGLSAQKVNLPGGDVAIVAVTSIAEGSVGDVSEQEKAYFAEYVARNSGESAFALVQSALKASAEIEIK